METNSHAFFYSYAKYYDIAFDFKNIPLECRFLEAVYWKHHLTRPRSFIEFAAGPAAHCFELSRSLQRVTAVDLSAEMQAYTTNKAQELGISFRYDLADMCHYKSTTTYDFAAIFMDSTSYLLTNEQMLQHLKCVAAALNPEGLYILEMSHPRSVFNVASSTVNEWEMHRGSTKVKMQWGRDGDSFDPISQITNVSILMSYDENGMSGRIEDQAPQRCYTATEFEALVKASGVFEIIDWYGAMDINIGFNNDSRAWRMLPVLKKLALK